MPVKSSARKKMTRSEQRELDVKIEFIEGLVRREPDYVDALQLLGDHYTQRGRYIEGLKVDERLARLQPGDALVFYNLACSYSLTEQFDRAVLALEKALARQGPRPSQTPPATRLPRHRGQNPPAESQGSLRRDVKYRLVKSVNRRTPI